MSAGANSGKAVMAALIANSALAVLKFIAFLLTNSSAMLAESVHSVADAGNQGLLLVGGRRARREASKAHPFGYGRERYIYAFIVAIVLFSLGGLFALYEGWHKLRDPHPITEWAWVPVAVIIGGMLFEGYALRTACVEANKVRAKGQSWVHFIRHSKSPEIPVVLLEDTGALLGLALALVGVGLTLVTGNGVWDGLGTVCIGVLLVAIAVVLALEIKSLLLGEGASLVNFEAIERALAEEPLVDRIIHMKTLHLGPDELLVAAKIAVSSGDTAGDVIRAIQAAQARIRAAVPIARVMYLEPDLDRPVS